MQLYPDTNHTHSQLTWFRLLCLTRVCQTSLASSSSSSSTTSMGRKQVSRQLLSRQLVAKLPGYCAEFGRVPQSPFIGRRVPLVDNGVPILYPRYTAVADIVLVRISIRNQHSC